MQCTLYILFGSPRKILCKCCFYPHIDDTVVQLTTRNGNEVERLGLIDLDPKPANAPFLLPSQVAMTLRISRIRTVRHGGASIRTSLEIIARSDIRILIWPSTVRRQGRTRLVSMVNLFHFLLERPALRHMVRGSHAGQEIQQERQDVEGKDQCDDPFKHGGDILVTREGRAREGNGQGNLDEDEREFDPEADAQDPVGSVVDAQTLVLGAQEDCGQDVAGNKQEEKAVMHVRVAICVEYRQEDEACGSGDRANDGEDGQDLLRGRRVRGETTGVSEPAFGHEAQVQEDSRDDGAGDEERFETEGARVGYVSYRLLGLHGR